MPRSGIGSNTAAFALVFALYCGDEREYESDNGRWTIQYPGLLSRDQLTMLAERIWPAVAQGESRELPRADHGTGAVPSHAAGRMGSIIDELTLAEIVLRTEGQRALSGCVLGIGGAFLRAARAVESCINALTEPAAVASGTHLMRAVAPATDALKAVVRLERWLPPAPGRFATTIAALEAICGMDDTLS
jgi:hypothetical protein